MNRWSVWIDIEGFGDTYEKGSQALKSLGALMEGIYRIGTHCFAEPPNRIFAHQTGDAFIIVGEGEFKKKSLEEPLAIAIALMRHVLARGGAAKAAISEGEFADIKGCYPEEIREQYAKHDGGAFPLGQGVMTIFPVMGTALINAQRLIDRRKTPSGSFIVVEKTELLRLPPNTKVSESPESDKIVIVDWIHTSYTRLDRIIKEARLGDPPVENMVRAMEDYTKSNTTLTPEWIDNTRRFLHLTEFENRNT